MKEAGKSSAQPEADEIREDDLVRIEEIQIDTSLPPEQRMRDYLKKVKNPYAFRCGQITVRLCFDPDGKGLGDLLRDYFIKKQADGSFME